MAKRRVWVPVKTLVLVEVETELDSKAEIFELAAGIAYESNLHTLPSDDWQLDEDEIDNPLPHLIDEWVED